MFLSALPSFLKTAAVAIASAFVSEEFWRQTHTTSEKSLRRHYWIGSPIMDDAAPVPAMGFARVAMESAILNYFVRHAHPLVIDEHFDTDSSDAVM